MVFSVDLVASPSKGPLETVQDDLVVVCDEDTILLWLHSISIVASLAGDSR
jgi:hypothetical protein